MACWLFVFAVFSLFGCLCCMGSECGRVGLVVVVGIQVGRLVGGRLSVFGLEVGGDRPSLG